MSDATAGAPAGAARLVLVEGVGLLHPETSVTDAMLDGWARQQRVRFLKASTVSHRVRMVRRMIEFSNLYPWQWTAPEVEAFVVGQSGATAASTIRAYTADLRMFLEYLTDPRYGWVPVCLERFGEAPQQVIDEWNSVTHTSAYEGAPGRRPLTYQEVQRLFDAADDIVEAVRARKRKGALAAQRDAAILKTVYAYGLRRREAWGLDLSDLRRNPKVPAFGQFGALYVRWGKAKRGGTPRRRTVMLVPEMDWIVPVLDQWLEEVRPRFDPGQHAALWATERRSRLDWRGINDAFAEARDAAGLDKELDLHCLRHSYVTHLVEFDYPERFVQEQVGHAYAATTAIYTGVSDAYRNTLLRRAIDAHQPDLWLDPEEGNS
ncbi:tyrosine-type recombinase/integrase [Cellulomonas sp. ES6]|uniref:tyrosine-type recombinase/integrase n=1 Tax=Cellulomonas sp. ES6 TaxID=3039384 RepID=UPI0024B7A536|nr:tyrosine-type recombinase/integrase [Cellulomonas sp. ES6]WHP16484.1 tyrosine-type recombinase/integrase [Cellulomonas sp. ES6]